MDKEYLGDMKMKKETNYKIIFCLMILWLIQGIFIHEDLRLFGLIEIFVSIIVIEFMIFTKFIPYLKKRFEEYIKNIVNG